eukprot:scaffold148352_cov31-Tisochrysis_lutea.AAC.2
MVAFSYRLSGLSEPSLTGASRAPLAIEQRRGAFTSAHSRKFSRPARTRRERCSRREQHTASCFECLTELVPGLACHDALIGSLRGGGGRVAQRAARSVPVEREDGTEEPADPRRQHRSRHGSVRAGR